MRPQLQVQILADIFTSDEAREILKNRFVLMIGDSVIRAMYKDLVKFLQTNQFLTESQLKVKGEFKFENDVLLEGGQKGVMSNDTSYTELREYKTPSHLIRFYFITRCYSDYLVSICEDIRNESIKPDVVIMNSGCWDLTRYGPNGIHEYKKNLPAGIFSLMRVLPDYTVFLWTSTLPVSKDVRGGFMIPEVECTKMKLREDVLEANQYAYYVMREFKLDFLDLHFYFRKQTHRRAKDGIHWDCIAHRRMTNLILNHLCDVWNIQTPGRTKIVNDPNVIEPPPDAPENMDDFNNRRERNGNREYLFMSDESNSNDSHTNDKNQQYQHTTMSSALATHLSQQVSLTSSNISNGNNTNSNSNILNRRRVIIKGYNFDIGGGGSSGDDAYSEYGGNNKPAKRQRLEKNNSQQQQQQSPGSPPSSQQQQHQNMLMQQQLQHQIGATFMNSIMQQQQQDQLTAVLTAAALAASANSHHHNPLAALAMPAAMSMSSLYQSWDHLTAALQQPPSLQLQPPPPPQTQSYDWGMNSNGGVGGGGGGSVGNGGGRIGGSKRKYTNY